MSNERFPVRWDLISKKLRRKGYVVRLERRVVSVPATLTTTWNGQVYDIDGWPQVEQLCRQVKDGLGLPLLSDREYIAEAESGAQCPGCGRA
jgi:hypothetical protein